MRTTNKSWSLAVEYADFRGVCLGLILQRGRDVAFGKTAGREKMWHLARLQAGKREVEKLVHVILQRVGGSVFV